MALVEQEVTLRIQEPGIEQKVYAIQDDTGRAVTCLIDDWTIPSGATATIYVKKPSGEVTSGSCTVSTSTNSATVTLTSAMLSEVGSAEAMVKFTSSSSTVTTFRFLLVVRAKTSSV